MDNSVTSPGYRPSWTTDDIRTKIEKSKVLVFAKGNPDQPRDGFSERAFQAIDDTGKPYDVVDVADDRSIVAALRAYAGRVTLPMVYVDGELVTSSETLTRMVDDGEFQRRVNRAFNS